MQVVTVTVRAIATRDLTPGQATWVRTITKELMVAAMNASLFAVINGRHRRTVVP